MANITNKLNKITGENIQAVNVTQYAPTGSTAATLTTANEATYLGGLYNKDSTGYFKWKIAGVYPISRMTTVNQANFAKLVRDFGTDSITLLIDVNITFSTNFTIPSNITIATQYPAIISTTGNTILTFNSPVRAGQEQTFNISTGSTANLILNANSVVEVDWFGAKGDSITVDTFSVQKAVNSAQGKTLRFSEGKTYVINGIILPLNGIRLDGNNCNIEHDPINTGNTNGSGVFSVSFNRTNLTTGIHTGGGSITLSASNQAVFDTIEFYNFKYNGKFRAAYLFSSVFGTYSSCKKIIIRDNKIRNCAAKAINISGSNTYFKYNGNVKEVLCYNNTFEWGGAMLGLIMTTTNNLGSNSFEIKTIDGGTIQERIQLGRFFQLGSAYQSDADSAFTYSTTAALYRGINFVLGISSDRGILTVESGDYSDASGFIPYTDNTGLRSPMLMNTWILPCESIGFPSIIRQPQFSGASGATVLTRALTTSIENAYATSLYVGMEFAFSSGSPLGLYKIIAINLDGSINIDRGITSAATSQQIKITGIISPDMAISGDIKQVTIRNNYMEGGSHGIQYGGPGGLNDFGIGMFSEDGDSQWNIYNNEFYYKWISIEGSFGQQTSTTCRPFNTMNVAAGQTVLVCPIPSNFKVIQKDINGDGILETMLTESTTSDANATFGNSIFIGDIFGFDSIKGRYIIKDISTNWPSVPTITIAKVDPYNRREISGGLNNSNPNISNLSTSQMTNRSYSPYIGSMGIVKQMNIHDNKFFYTIRSSGGYACSAAAFGLNIYKNYFFQCNATTLEISGCNVVVNDNSFNAKPFLGNDAIPAVPYQKTANYMKSQGAWLTGNPSNLSIINNEFSSYDDGLGQNANGFGTNHNALYNYDQDKLYIQKNTIPSVSNGLIRPSPSTAIDGVNQAAGYFNICLVSDNFISRHPLATDSAIINRILAIKTVIKDNIISGGANTFETIFTGDVNRYLMGTSNYDITIRDNSCDRPIVDSITVPYLSKIGFGNPGLNRQLLINKTSVPIAADILDGQAAIYRNTTTNKSSVYANVGGTIVDLIGAAAGIKATYTVSGTGQTTITIPHGMGTTPSYTNVNAKSADARNAGIIGWTENAANIIITLALAANTGTNNLSYSWEAK